MIRDECITCRADGMHVWQTSDARQWTSGQLLIATTQHKFSIADETEILRIIDLINRLNLKGGRHGADE